MNNLNPISEYKRLWEELREHPERFIFIKGIPRRIKKR